MTTVISLDVFCANILMLENFVTAKKPWLEHEALRVEGFLGRPIKSSTTSSQNLYFI